MRKPRYLPTNKAVTCPTRAIWVDTETLSTEESPGLDRHDLWFGWAVYRRRHRTDHWTPPEWYMFTSRSQFWEWCLDHVHHKTALYTFAHNAGYDLTVLNCWEELHGRQWNLTGCVLDSPPFLATWRQEKKVLKAVCTLNLWKVKLDKLGEVVGIPKLPMPEHKNLGPEWHRYCRRDVEVIMEMCLRWWAWLRKEDMGSAAVTLAAQALTTYRHRFMTHKIFIDGNEKATRLARDGYSGGRTECFTLGKVPTPNYVYDINSLYPSVMQAEEFPAHLQLHARNVSTSECSRWLKNYCVMARVQLDTPEAVYPHRVPSYLLFPTGRFETVLATPELAHALERGRVTKIIEAAVYTKAPIFKAYVDEFYERRLAYIAEGDKFGSKVCKLFLVSLYGKFGQLGWVTEIRAEVPWTGVGAWTEIDADTGRTYRMRALGGVLVVEYQDGEARFSQPVIAAHVTAWGRLRLWELFIHVGLENVSYSDTDSVRVNEAGRERILDLVGPGLGQLKLEKTTRRTMTIYGPKDYEADGDRICKGVKKTARWINSNQVEQEMWLGIKGLIQKNHTESPLVQHQTRTLQRIYRKGVVTPSGRTRPWRLPEETGLWASG